MQQSSYILLPFIRDERFEEDRNVAYVSKWLRKSIKNYESFDESLVGLRTFFADAEKQFNKKGVNTLKSEPLISDMNKENFPDTKNSVSDQVIHQKRNQKEKKLDYQNEKEVISNNTVTSAKTNKSNKSSPPLKKYVDSHSPLNESPFNCCKDYIDLESNFSIYSRYSETSIASSKSSLDCSIVIKNTEDEGQAASPVDIYTADNSDPAVQAINQFPERSPLFPLSNIDSDANLSEVTCTYMVSPERVVQIGLCNPALDLSSNLSVNSHCQKRRKLIVSQSSSSNQMARLSLPEAESLSTCQRTESSLTHNGLICENQKSIQESFMEATCGSLLPFSSNLTVKEKLRLCCFSCKTQIGLCKNNFLVTCLLASSSKAYLVHVLKNGPESSFPPEFLQWIPQPNVPVVVSETTSVNQQFVNKCHKSSPHDTWSEPDGCVFRVVSCPFCTLSQTYLGLQIMATDASNIHLLNKIIFYADRLDIRKEETLKEEGTSPICKSDCAEDLRLFAEEKYASILQSMDSESLSRTKVKLRLPKSKQFSVDN